MHIRIQTVVSSHIDVPVDYISLVLPEQSMEYWESTNVVVNAKSRH